MDLGELDQSPPGGSVAGHEIGYSSRACRSLEGGLKHVRIGEIGLAALARRLRPDVKSSPSLIVQYRGKDTGGIELGQATPVDGAVDPYQGRRKHVSNDSIVAYTFITHFQTQGIYQADAG